MVKYALCNHFVILLPGISVLRAHREALRRGAQRDLVFVLGMSLMLYAALAVLFFLPPLLARGRVTIGTLTNRSLTGTLALLGVGITLYTLYAAGAWLVWRSNSVQTRRWVWIGAIVAALLLLSAHPATSTDIFDYVFRARMTLEYGANPYLALPNQYKGDPFYRYIGWPNAPSAYGPLWEQLSLAVAWLGGGSLLRHVLLLKLLATTAFLLCGVVIEALVRHERRRALALYAWLWSPLALWEFAAVGHNDGLLVLSLLLALLSAQRDRYGWAILALVGGALFKFLPIVFVPLVVLRWLRCTKTWAGRGRVLVGAALLVALPTIMVYAPYWDVPPRFVQLSLVDQLWAIWDGRATTLRNVSVREGFLNAAPLAAISYSLQAPRSLAMINDLRATFGWLAVDKTEIRAAVSMIGSVLLLLGVVYQAWQVWFKGRSVSVAVWGVLLWYVLSSQWFQPWYVLWLLALGVIALDRTRLMWLTAWAAAAQASYLLQYIVLPNLKISGQSLEAQMAYLLLIYLPPLIVWLATRNRHRPVPVPEPQSIA